MDLFRWSQPVPHQSFATSQPTFSPRPLQYNSFSPRFGDFHDGHPPSLGENRRQADNFGNQPLVVEQSPDLTDKL